MENLRCQVFRVGSIDHAPDNVGVDAIEENVVEIGESGRVPLCRLDEQTLVGRVTARFSEWPPSRHRLIVITGEGRKGYELFVGSRPLADARGSEWRSSLLVRSSSFRTRLFVQDFSVSLLLHKLGEFAEPGAFGACADDHGFLEVPGRVHETGYVDESVGFLQHVPNIERIFG